MIKWSPSTRGFYRSEIHGDNMPADAVPVTDDQHEALLAGQGIGQRIVADATGTPTLTPLEPETLESVRAGVIIRVKEEARRLILAIASIEQQINDLASGDEAGTERRRKIDLVRAASNQIEATVSTLTGEALSGFDVAAAFQGLIE